MQYDEERQILILDGPSSDKDYIRIQEKDWALVELNSAVGTGKGKNSSVFRAVDPDGEEDDMIVKFCRFHNGVKGEEAHKKRLRFLREIDALRFALGRTQGDYIVQIMGDGYFQLDSQHSVRYYAMEEADCDLSDYLVQNPLHLQQKLLLCYSIMQGLEALHELDIYHRDLKPENILFVGSQWKIADLGYCRSRDDDFDIDIPHEKIGPAGLMSPEATNNLLANREHPLFGGDCDIDKKSDIYQMGMLFWFIMQGDIPTGQLAVEDFRESDIDVYSKGIMPMLQHSKNRRASMAALRAAFDPIFLRHAVTG